MKRPLSPFLSVYKPQITSIFSIMERVTGVILVLVMFYGVILVKLEPIFLSYYSYYSISYWLIKGSVSGLILGGLVLFILLNIVYHVIFGVRYLYWDRVFNRMSINEINKTTPYLVGLTLGLTLLVWFML